MKPFRYFFPYGMFIILNLFVINLQSQSYYYYDKKINLKYLNNQIVVYFYADIPEQKIQDIIRQYSMEQLFSVDGSNHDLGPTLLNFSNSHQDKELLLKLGALNKEEYISGAYPVFISEHNVRQGLTNEFIVKLKSDLDLIHLRKLVSLTKTQIIGNNSNDALTYFIRVNKTSMGNALEMASYFYENGDFAYTDPIFIYLDAFNSNDEFYSDQWAIENTGQYNGVPGYDLGIQEAWNYTTGNEDVKIAIIDVGVDIDHPDLIDNMLPGYNAWTNQPGGNAVDNEYHGTACAGIIAASKDNTIGIAGVCPDCKILPIRLIFDQAHMGMTNDAIARGFDWAVQNGAKIISNSYGGFTESGIVTDAINNAVSSGCVVLFSTGNSNGATQYPAYLESVIAVGANSMCFERCSPASCNDESWWGSNYGIELDVVAPGTKIATTDIAGDKGQSYSDPDKCYNDDYIKYFGGTSAACPFAAGVVGLILSANCELSNQEARRILELSCYKPDIYSFANTICHTNGQWNHEIGHGVVNAYKAVQYALSFPSNDYSATGGVVVETTDFLNVTILAGGCLYIASGVYYAKRSEVRKVITYPNTISPVLFVNSNGLSAENPNPANGFAEVLSFNENSATVRVYVYETYNTLGQYIGWLPTSPANIHWDYTVISEMANDLYLQNRSETATVSYEAMNRIISGNNVISTIPQGNFVVESNSSVTLHSGNQILLEPGSVVNTSSFFHAYISPFFICPGDLYLNQYVPFNDTEGKNSQLSSNSSLSDSTVFLIDNLLEEDDSILVNIYPNPVSSILSIRIISKTEHEITISIVNSFGEKINWYNSSYHINSGLNEIFLDFSRLDSGIYLLLAETNTHRFIKKIIKK